jgi:hypothetical protein
MKTLILLFSVLFTTMSFGQVPNYVPASGLVGYWPFNGNANDESGNGNNGTNNGATMTTDRNGVANQAYSFDGLAAYISASPTLPTGPAPRTVSCWFNTSASYIPTSDYPPLQTMTAWGNSSPGLVIFPQYVKAPSGKAYFESGSNGNQLYSQNAMNDGVWHQIVTTYNGAGNRVKMYVDGVLQDSSAVVTLGTADSYFVIGNSPWTNIPFMGQIDDVGLWNRALTDCEIQNLYNSSNPTNTTTITACNSYTWNGETYTQSGVYTGNTANCITQSLNLTITPAQTQPIGLSCWQTATFNTITCAWDVTGTQPAQPTLACYQSAEFNTTTCAWVVGGTIMEPTGLECYQTAILNQASCQWNIGGTQPVQPTLACYQTLGSFNTTSCSWDVTGTQPTQPTLACYETATFNTTTCSWVISGPQAPQKMSYQAVIRNSADSLLISTPVSMRISLVQGTPSGTVVFSETQTATTNANGLVSLQIGMGTVVTGTFACIDWAAGPYYVKTETDLAGGTNYTIISSNELLSVPYALFSANGPTGPQGPAGPQGSVGLTGATGPQGPQGETGAIGPQGATGAIGPAGETGSQGIQGETGLTGPQGPIGLTGANGTPGATGITITSVSTAGDTLYLSNGQIFVAGSNTSGTGALVLPTITTNAVTGITSNSATFGGAISNANGNQIMERGIVYSTIPNPTIGSNKILIGNGIGTFDTISALGYYQYAHLLNPNTTYYVRAYAVTENNISAYGNEVSFTTLSVGQAGPGGGIVFFNKGNSTSGWQYLETATSDQSTGLSWGCTGLSIPGTQLAVGSGEANTSLIVAGCNEDSFPAKICDNLSLGGQTDWFLPSRDELNLMYKNLHTNNQGNFSDSFYWSSSEDGASHAGSLSLTSGSAGNGSMPKHLTLYVRAIRAF